MRDNILGGATFAKGKEQRAKKGEYCKYMSSLFMDVMNHTMMTDDLTIT